MDFIISANTDIGLVKRTNQDALSVKILDTPQGPMAFAVLCDGMGGLALGEVASASVVEAFDRWARLQLPALCRGPIEDGAIRAQWEAIVAGQDERIKQYGAGRGVHLGTTVVALLLTQSRYYAMNVGDSRAYELAGDMLQLTNDHSLVAREVALGNLTPEQARHDRRRNVLLQCVGGTGDVSPEMYFGDVCQGGVYMLCSDGFCHELEPEEVYGALQPGALLSQEDMNSAAAALIELNKQRGETDNISVALVRTF